MSFGILTGERPKASAVAGIDVAMANKDIRIERCHLRDRATAATASSISLTLLREPA
jgi:hypothetical protein